MVPNVNARSRTCLQIGVAIAASLAIAPAFADDTVGTSESLYGLYAPDLGATTEWRFTLGAGVVDMPTFPGADSRKTEVVPLASANHGRFFIGANPDAASFLSLGGYLVRDAQWRVGLAVTYDFVEPRAESDDVRLQGLGDVDRTTHAELFAVYTVGWASLRGSVLSDIGGNQRGATATFDALGILPINPKWILTFGPGLTWASDQYMRTYFGVDGQQSAASGLPMYRPGSGLSNVRVSAGSSYRPNAHWSIGANVAAAWLQGDADDSPIREKSNQMTYSLFANYLF